MHLSRMPLVLAIAFTVALVAPPAIAGAPTDGLKSNIDQVLRILEDPDLKARPEERRAALRKMASEIFDVAAAAQRSLGRHWQVRTPGEREEFIQLFGRLLETSYLTKIELYGGEKIVYGGDTVDGDRATVRTRILTREGTEIPVDYRMLKRGDRWMVYDVSIEGIGLISNYRTQFNRIIQTTSYEELVRKLRAKQEEFAQTTKPAT